MLSRLGKWLLAVLLAAGAGGVAAGELDDAIDALKRGDYEAALADVRPRAEAGSADAQYLLSYMYLEGKGVSANERTAFVWCHKAAKQDHRQAQRTLARFYALGIGVKRDAKLSSYWQTRARGEDVARPVGSGVIDDTRKRLLDDIVRQPLQRNIPSGIPGQ